MRISLIAAMSRNRVIGMDNQLPWHLPEDLRRFRALTSGHPVIMGRKTFASIGKPLPHRQNIVISRQKGLEIAGAAVLSSLDEAFSCCASNEEVFVIGGAEIYCLALPKADRIYLTLVDREIEGDAFFPEWPKETFRETEREDRDGFSFLLLERVS